MGACCSAPPSNGPGAKADVQVPKDTSDQRWVQQAAKQLEQTNLIFAIDFTNSNVPSTASFGSPSLHAPRIGPNLYEEVISSLSQAVYPPGRECLLSAIGFGDVSAQDMAVFSFFNGDAPARGLNALLSRYRELVPWVKVAGLLSFAPAIYQGMRLVGDSCCQHHTLVILTSGQVTRPQDLPTSQLSRQEQATMNAIVAASELPLSIIVVGLGDGPWDAMHSFCEKLPERRWPNFRFLPFSPENKQQAKNAQTAFAAQALSAIPSHLKVVQKLGLLGCAVTIETNVRSLPPPTSQDVCIKSSMQGALQLSPSDGSDGTTSSLAQQRSATAFERWADGSQGAKSSASQGLVYPRAPGPSVPSPFSTWVNNNMPRSSPGIMEPLPEVGGPYTSSTHSMPPMYGPGPTNSGTFDYSQAGYGPASVETVGGGVQTPPGSGSVVLPPTLLSSGMGSGMLPPPMGHSMGPPLPPLGPGMLQPPAMMPLGIGPGGMHPHMGPDMLQQPPPMSGLPAEAFHHPGSQPLSLQPTCVSEVLADPMIEEEDVYYDPQFICPLSGKLMSDPVMACDGYTYDRAGITEWLLTHDTSPETKQTLPHKELTPNYQLKANIDEFLAAMQQSSVRRL